MRGTHLGSSGPKEARKYVVRPVAYPWIGRLLWMEVCPSHAKTAGCRQLQQSRQAEYDRLTALPRWSRRGEMSGAPVYRIPSAEEVNQFTFEDSELI